MKPTNIPSIALTALIIAGGCSKPTKPISDSWTIGAPMPMAISSAVSGVINGKLYVATGCYKDPVEGYSHVSSVFQVYDSGRNKWTTLMPGPSPIYGAIAGVIDDKLYITGGTRGTDATMEHILPNELFVYDPSKNNWTLKSPIPTERMGAAAGVIDGKLYVVGGTGTFHTLNVLEVYNPASDTWTTKSPIPTPRANAMAGVINGKLYVVGGSQNFSTVEVYDPTSDTWVTKTPMPTARFWAASSVIDEQLYIVGGFARPAGRSSIINILEVYNPILDSWIIKESMPTARMKSVAATINGKLYVVGGSTNDGYVPLLEIYTP